MNKIDKALLQRAERAEAEAADLRERVARAEEENARLRTGFAQVKQAKQALAEKMLVQIYEFESLRKRLARVTDLVPEPELLEWAASFIESYMQDWPDWTERAKAVATVSVFREWAEAVHEWREEQERSER